jgi:hypothetical protein
MTTEIEHSPTNSDVLLWPMSPEQRLTLRVGPYRHLWVIPIKLTPGHVTDKGQGFHGQLTDGTFQTLTIAHPSIPLEGMGSDAVVGVLAIGKAYRPRMLKMGRVIFLVSLDHKRAVCVETLQKDRKVLYLPTSPMFWGMLAVLWFIPWMLTRVAMGFYGLQAGGVWLASFIVTIIVLRYIARYRFEKAVVAMATAVANRPEILLPLHGYEQAASGRL